MSEIHLPGVTRREFVRVATVAVAALVGGRRVLAATGDAAATTQRAAEKPIYSFPLLGDVHYDKMSHHDLDWVRKEKPGDERQMLNYSKVTETLTPGLFANVSAAVKSSAAPVPFVVQVGDLVEGLCGSYELSALQFREAFGAIEAAAFGAPFLITKGNHDITGPGAVEAYNKDLIPWLAGQGKQADFAGANYFRRQDDDLFVFFDGYVPDLDWLERTLAANKARHVFFVTHQPVVPYNARANWCVFTNKAGDERRPRLLALLAKYRAIALTGHLHKYCLLTRAVEDGMFTQLAVSSVLRAAEEKKPKDVLDGVEKFGPSLVDLEPKFGPETLDYRKELLATEAASIKRFSYSDVPGFAMVKVYADRVDADIYVSLAKEPWKADPISLPRTPAAT